MKCSYPSCKTKTAKYLMGWKNSEGVKVWGLVCATHDKYQGRKNLMEYAGMSLQEAIDFEKEKEE